MLLRITVIVNVCAVSYKACLHYESNAHWKGINSHCCIHAECAFGQSTSIGGLKANYMITEINLGVLYSHG